MNPEEFAQSSLDAFSILHRAFMRIGALDRERRRAWDTINHAQKFLLTTGVQPLVEARRKK